MVSPLSSLQSNEEGAAPINATSQVAATTYTMPPNIGKYLCKMSSDPTFLSKNHNLTDLTQKVSYFSGPIPDECGHYEDGNLSAGALLEYTVALVLTLIIAGLIIAFVVAGPSFETALVGIVSGCVAAVPLWVPGAWAVSDFVFLREWHAFEKKIKEAQQYYEGKPQEGYTLTLQDFLNRVPLTRAPLLDAPHSLYPPSDPSSYTYT